MCASRNRPLISGWYNGHPATEDARQLMVVTTFLFIRPAAG
ncbi:hypothetical protein [Paraburkholderia sp. BR10923]